MKLINAVTLALVALFATSHAVLLPEKIAQLSSNPLVNARTLSIVSSLQQKVINAGGCGPNICFALDGSGSISAADYEAQKGLVELVAVVVGVDTSTELAAVQYGLRNIGISLITGDVDRFLLDVEASSLARARRTFIAGGLAFCIRQLSQRPGDANKIVLLGDGRSNFGGNPVPIAQKFLEEKNHAICSVGVGFQNTNVLQAIAGGDASRVLTTDDWLEVTNILADLVQQVCGFPPDF